MACRHHNRGRGAEPSCPPPWAKKPLIQDSSEARLNRDCPTERRHLGHCVPTRDEIHSRPGSQSARWLRQTTPPPARRQSEPSRCVKPPSCFRPSSQDAMRVFIPFGPMRRPDVQNCEAWFEDRTAQPYPTIKGGVWGSGDGAAHPPCPGCLNLDWQKVGAAYLSLTI